MPDNKGDRALDNCAGFGDLDGVKLLLEAKAQLNQRVLQKIIDRSKKLDFLVRIHMIY